MKEKENIDLIMDDWNETSISGYTMGEKLKLLVSEICDMIDDVITDEEMLVDLLINLPADLSFEIYYNTKFKSSKKLAEILNARYFSDFIKDLNCKNKKGFNNFQLGMKEQTKENSKKFLKNRFLTKFELELIFEEIKNQDKTIACPAVAVLKNYKVEDEKLLALIDANDILNKKSTFYDKIIDSIIEDMLNNLLFELKSRTVTVENE